MRQARFKMEGAAIYHCVTRTVAGEHLLHAREKEVLRKMLWKVAAFCGVEVLSYCLMSNHFHVLVRVSEKRDLSVPELLERYGALYRENPCASYPAPEVMALILGEEDEEAQRWVERLVRRMDDVSEFMKTLKQRFSVWYNHTHDRFGTLWAERFKSALVEDASAALKTVAAYIDLNPVRAGLNEDPADYRWSSYGEAMGGSKRAQAGLSQVVGETDWAEAGDMYRMVLYGKGAMGRAGEEGIIPREKVVSILAGGGKVPRSSLLRCRLRYLTDGAVFGSREFVEKCGRDLSRGNRARKGSLQNIPDEDNVDLVAWRHLNGAAVS